MARYGMVIEIDKCLGCRACMEACKVENNTPQGHFWMYVFRLEEGEFPNVRQTFMPRSCMHCDNPPCVQVCPTQARFKRTDGLVLTDFDRCIGCQYCSVACPYGVNYLNSRKPSDNYYLDWTEARVKSAEGNVPPYDNPDLNRKHKGNGRRIAGGGHYKGVIEKCTFCVQRLDKGLEPACANACPVDALHFGDLDDPESEISKLLGRRRSFRLKEDLNTQPKVHYVGATAPSSKAREIEAVKGRV